MYFEDHFSNMHDTVMLCDFGFTLDRNVLACGCVLISTIKLRFDIYV